MKKAVALVIALALLSCGALAEERSFALNRDRTSDIYTWDGKQLTQPDTYISIYSITDGRTAPEEELFAAQSAKQELPEDSDYASPLYAILDWQGNPLTDFKYDSVDYNPSGDALVYSIDGLFGAMTRNLQELVPCKYDAVAPDGEGGFILIAHSSSSAPSVLHMKKGGKPKTTGVKARFYWSGMTEGLMSANDAQGYYGFLNAEGHWAIKPAFEWAQSFTAGYSIVRQKGKTGIIDKTGKWTVKPTYDDDRGILSDGSAAILIRGTRAYFVRPSDGKPLFSVRLSNDGYVSIGPEKPLIAVIDKGRNTLYDNKGKVLLSLADGYSFDLWSTQPEDRLLATSTNKGILMDMSGKKLYEGQGLNYLDTVEGRTLYTAARYKTHMVKYEGDDKAYEEPIYETYRYGIVDADGNQLQPMVYRQLYQLVSGRYFAQDAKRWGVIDPDGKWIVLGSVYDQLMD
jgi:hypothetical protein